MLDSEALQVIVAHLKREGWHSEHELIAGVRPHQVGTVVATLQVLLVAGVIRQAGEGETKRFLWIGHQRKRKTK